jgi:pyruvate-formate lyase-activating enzyme
MEKLQVLFIIPPYGREKEGDIHKEVKKLLPLGPLKLEAYCRDIADFDFINYNFAQSISEVTNLDMLPNIDYDVICISTTFCATLFVQEDNAIKPNGFIWFIEESRKKYPRAKIFCGGNLHWTFPEIENYVDWICYYEGEKPLRRALLNLDNLQNSYEPELLTQEEMDAIPPLKVFQNAMVYQLGTGCLNHCVFCVSPRSLTRKSRHPSAEKVIRDLNYYKEQGVVCLCIVDDCLFLDRDYYIKVFNHIKKLEIKCFFLYYTLYLDDEEMDLLADVSARRYADFNIDACSEEIMHKAGKKGSFKHIEYMIDYFKKKGMISNVRILVNYPFETEKDREGAIEYFSNLDIEKFDCLPVIPLEGSLLWDDFMKMGSKNIEPFLVRGVEIANNFMEKVNSALKNKRKSLSTQDSSSNITLQVL